ncbi:hypothetical protein, partial [Helicobacter pullorum]|uniref:hypothetical protein n=1 Tax=Helicobacter pullorum TaxID=35818 RepID=UPI000AC09C2B
QNTGTITGNVQLIGNQKNCDNEICKNSDLINTGTIGDVANNTGGTIINQKDDVLNSISNGEENGVDSAIIVGNVENSGEIKDIINYNNGTIQGIINNKDADSIIGKIQNTGVMGGISNAGNITTIN